jgi:hypothetical protein
MNSKLWIRKALSMCLVVATMATYSMVTLANSEKIAGELTISSKNALAVKVNGEVAQNGRSIFSSSTIATPENTSAVINLGKAGKVELAPNTVLTISFNNNGISGNLNTGQITVLNASQSVNVTTPNGTLVKLNAGETATANGRAQDDDDTSGGGSAWLVWALVLGGAAAGIIIAATTDNNRVSLGGGTTVVSPTR